MTEGGSEVVEARASHHSRTPAEARSDEYRSKARIVALGGGVKPGQEDFVLSTALEDATKDQLSEADKRAKKLDKLGIIRRGPNHPL